MSAAAWIVFALATAAAVAGSIWVYRQRESPGRGRGWLAGLRAASLALLLLLLFDPDLPGGASGGGPAARILLDHSLSMSVETSRGDTRWQAALDVVEREEAAARAGVMLFGDEPRIVMADSLGQMAPAAARSQLLPALQAMAEAGVREIIVVTDGGFDDADEVRRWLPRLGLELRVVTVGEPAANRGLVEVTAPTWAEAGAPIEIQVGIAATGEAADSVLVSALDRGEIVAQALVATPAEGRIATATLTFEARPPVEGSQVRYDLVLEGGDAAAEDDRRSVYVDVSDEPGGIAFLSFRPDWETRFLQPVLERALGLPIRGFLRADPATWVRGASGLRTAERASEDQVRQAVAAADLVVLHAYGEASPGWIHELVPNIPRLLILPSGQAGSAPMPIPVGSAVSADWYLTPAVPPSPIAHLLAGLETDELPPLPALRLVDEPETGWVPLMASRGRRGGGYPIAVGGTSGRRRWAVALGEGFWRWAFRGDAARDTYERMWSALAGWLVEDQTIVTGGDAISPLRRVVARDAPLRWVTTGAVPDSFAVLVQGEDGSTVVDATMTAASDTLAVPAIPAGNYAYTVRTFSGGESESSTGPITVESFSADYTRPRVDAARLEEPVISTGSVARGPRVPLRTVPWPWAILITILCLEWVLRRRWGLR